MEDKANIPDERDRSRWTDRVEDTTDDPEFNRKMEVARHVVEKYSEALQRLADS
jgi:hypothetical protein